jgi:thiol-disulfide isomerase/thioredoxin
MVHYGETGRPGDVAARKPFVCSYLIVIVMLASLLQTTSVLAQGSSSKSFPYLYATLDDPNASYPVIDHLSPPHRGLDKDTEDRPAFLYDPDNGYRIVEYYIHWCQACRLFAPVYTKFAQKVTEIAAAQGVSLKVYAVNCSPNRKLCLEQSAKDYPKIRLYRVNETNYHEVGHHLQLHPYSVLDTLGITFDRAEDDPWDVEREMAHGATDGVTVRTWLERTLSFLGLSGPAAVVYHRSRDDLKADIHLSFDYALRHNIFVSNDALGHDESKLFREWLELVLLAIPSSWGMADLLHELINNFVYVSRSHSYLVAVLDEFPPPKDVWSPSCSKGAPDQGYTCGRLALTLFLLPLLTGLYH